MEYLKVKWQHHHSDEPIEIYSEIAVEIIERHAIDFKKSG